jgi:hypothetical protein
LKGDGGVGGEAPNELGASPRTPDSLFSEEEVSEVAYLYYTINKSPCQALLFLTFAKIALFSFYRYCTIFRLKLCLKIKNILHKKACIFQKSMI